MFGNSGFGVQANYTYVNSGLKYDNGSVGEQFALVGLGDSANLVGIFENDKWNVRAAYNWRDEFLSSTFDGSGPNPNYVEAYGQLDLSIGYNVNKNLSVSVRRHQPDRRDPAHARPHQAAGAVRDAIGSALHARGALQILIAQHLAGAGIRE